MHLNYVKNIEQPELQLFYLNCLIQSFVQCMNFYETYHLEWDLK